MRNLKNWDTLLADIATGLKKTSAGNTRVRYITVTFLVPGMYPGFDFGLVDALDAISNDLYFDERGNWSEATRARVETA